MDSIAKTLSFIKDAVVFITTELKHIERMNQFISTNILTYEVAINNLLDTIQNLNNPLYNQILSQTTLCSIISLVNAHVMSLKKLVIKMTKWNNNIKAGGFRKIRALVRDRPSVLSEILFQKLLEIKPLLFEICQIEKNTLGSGIRIRHPILRAAWVLSGSNQVNDSSIEKNIMIENFYTILKKEMGGEIKKSESWKKAIQQMVDQIDGCAAGDPDNKISISELNEFVIREDKTTLRQILKDYVSSSSISQESSSLTPEKLLLLGSSEVPEPPSEKLLLESNENSSSEKGSEHVSSEKDISITLDKPDEDMVDIPVSFNSTEVNHSSKVEIPTCEGYGSNWPSIKLAEFTVPESQYPHLELDFIDIECVARDQGWGGTGHVNIRYQINEKPIEPAFFVDRNKSPDNKYKFTINYEKLSSGDTVKMWLSCPSWNGWRAKVDFMTVRATFD